MTNHQHHHQTDPIHHEHEHGHTHGTIDPLLATTERGIWAVKWSFIGLLITAIIQIVVVYFSGSIALFADTIHNFGDAATAMPLGIAFVLARRKPSRHFTYGLGKVEDLAGVTIVLIILISASVAGYESIQHLMNPKPIAYLGAVVFASLVGFAGNEIVAIFRMRVGTEIKSAALIADGYHARIDGWTSLAVLIGATGTWLGYPLVDPIVGLLITLAILKIVWESSTAIFSRLLDGVDPNIIEEIKHEAGHIPGVDEVTEVRGRWLGHRLYGEVNITVASKLSLIQAHRISLEVQHELLHHLPYLSKVSIHVDPHNASGEEYHKINKHTHDGFPVHSH